MSNIHPTAVIYDGAQIAASTKIGPYAVIGPKVVIGENNQIASHVVIEGNTSIGNGNKIFQFASVGAEPQDLKFKGEDSRLEIGDNNIIRESVTLQPGTAGGGMLSKIGNSNMFMAYSHLAHDSIVGSSCVIANSVAIAGHVKIGNYVVIGGLVGVHQFVKIGDSSMIGAGSMIAKDVPPFCIAQGDRAGLVGINKVGLERRGYSAEDIEAVQKLFRKLFLDRGILSEKLTQIRQDFKGELPELLISFVENSARGITPLRKNIDD